MRVEKIAKRPDVNPETGEKKYGNVEYADEKNHKYPLNTAKRVRAALRYIGMQRDSSKYSSDDLASMKAKMYAAAKKFNIDATASKSTESEEVPFRFLTRAIKAVSDENGDWYVVGEATGPEVDKDNERMSEDAIESMLEDIEYGAVNEFGDENPVFLRDAHAKDGVDRDLGEVVYGELKDNGHLFIKAKLDQDNPKAQYLYKSLKNGKAFGLSVSGIINGTSQEYDARTGKSHLCFDEFTLEEVSVTSRPSWDHSYLHSIAKSYIKNTAMRTQKDIDEEKKTAEELEAEKKALEAKEAEDKAKLEEEKNKKESSLESDEASDNQDKDTTDEETDTSKDAADPEEGEDTKKVEKSTHDKAKRVDKAMGKGVKMSHLSKLRDRTQFMSGMLGDAMSGRADTGDTLKFLKNHADTIGKGISALSSGDIEGFEKEFGKSDNGVEMSDRAYMSEKDKEEETKRTSKSEKEEDVVARLEKSYKETVERLEKRIKDLEDTPMPPKGHSFIVKKSQGDTDETNKSFDTFAEEVDQYKSDKAELNAYDFGVKYAGRVQKFENYITEVQRISK